MNLKTSLLDSQELNELELAAALISRESEFEPSDFDQIAEMVASEPESPKTPTPNAVAIRPAEATSGVNTTTRHPATEMATLNADTRRPAVEIPVVDTTARQSVTEKQKQTLNVNFRLNCKRLFLTYPQCPVPRAEAAN